MRTFLTCGVLLMIMDLVNLSKDYFNQLDLYLDGRLNFWLMGIGIGSTLLFIGSVIVSLMIIARLPANHFITWHLPREESGWHWAVHALWKVLKNIFGFVILVIGFIMLFLPGQGMLTILIALMILDFPYKKTILDGLVAKPKIQASLNWIRRRGGKKDFHFPETNAGKVSKGDLKTKTAEEGESGASPKWSNPDSHSDRSQF